jgi:hypothetical protein
VEGNKEGSFMTMMSIDGLVFGIINIIGNFGEGRALACWRAVRALGPVCVPPQRRLKGGGARCVAQPRG